MIQHDVCRQARRGILHVTCMHTLSCTSTRVVHTYDTTLQRLAVSDVANEISQKNSEDIRVCLRENRRRELRRYLLRSET